jgi:hypothetical protein
MIAEMVSELVPASATGASAVAGLIWRSRDTGCLELRGAFRHAECHDLASGVAST